MITFYFFYSIVFLKYILIYIIKLFLFKEIAIKVALILLFTMVLWLLYTYPKKRFRQLSKQRQYKLKWTTMYKLTSIFEKRFNIFILVVGPALFVIGIFELRFLNKDRVVDLKEFYINFKAILYNTPIFDSLLNFMFLVIFILVYGKLITKYTAYIKYHAIKRHIYLCDGNTDLGNLYILRIFQEVFCTLMVNNLYWVLRKKLELCYKHTIFYFFQNKKHYPDNYKKLSYEDQFELKMKFPVEPSCLFVKYNKASLVLDLLLKKGHYLMIVVIFFYDIKYNNFIISHIFTLLPLIFLYELYIRVSAFIDDFHLPYDESFHLLIYSIMIESYDEKTIIIGGEFHDKMYFSKMYNTYIKKNFVKDRNDLS